MMQTREERLALIREVHARFLARRADEDAAASSLLGQVEALETREDEDEVEELGVNLSFGGRGEGTDYFSIDTMEI